MITEKQIEIAKSLNSAGVGVVYHSAELIEDDKGVKFPAYKVGDEQYYVGPDDTKKMFGYIRQSGPATRVRETLEGSCAKMYLMQAPCRVVIFQDHTSENHDALARKFLRVAFIQGVSLISFSTNAFQLGKQESPIGKFAFDATTFYLAIDLQVKFWIFTNQCEDDECEVFPNPIHC
jgi:hypothetical protein